MTLDADIRDLQRTWVRRTDAEPQRGWLAPNFLEQYSQGKLMVQFQSGTGLSVPRPILYRPGVSIQLKAGTAVLVGFDEKNNEVIIGGDIYAANANASDPIGTAIQQSSSSTPQSYVETLRITQTNVPSLTINVKSWQPIVGTTIYQFAGGSIDLSTAGAGSTSLVPSAGQMCYAAIALESDYSTLIARASTSRATTDFPPLNAADAQEAYNALNAIDAACTPIGAIKLVGGQTQIAQSDIDNSLFDLRQLVNNAAVRPYAYTPSGSADTFGTQGDIAYDNSYLYGKAAGGWRRVAWSSF